MEFPLGAAVTVEQLDRDPHPVLARLREREPVSWVPALDGWLVTRYDLVTEAMRDSATFTVDDPRFSTAQVIGPSMLSLDGQAHERHRAPFVAPFRPRPVADRFTAPTTQRANRLLDELAPRGAGEFRRGFAGPIAAAIIVRALGLPDAQDDAVLGWYDAIVQSVTSITAGTGFTVAGRAAFTELRTSLLQAIEAGASLLADAAHAPAGLSPDELVSDAAVLLFGGIETTEGMIANALLHLLERPEQLERVRADPALLETAIEESLRLEPAAAVIDRYATADTRLGEAGISTGDLVRLSIAGANRDPALFPNPDELDLTGVNGRRHLAFAHGPHVCLGVHLARLEARTAIAVALRRLPGLRLDPERPASVRGLVFRKPIELHVRWDKAR
ncbi:MAG TPA: cytochrome P450 [Solirubrobacteraceae bacterium]|nr:cytochrome P450 [Solirubrobacteraceae bacterium]